MGCVHDLSDLLNQSAKETSSTAATYQSIYGCYHSYRRFSSRLSVDSAGSQKACGANPDAFQVSQVKIKGAQKRKKP